MSDYDDVLLKGIKRSVEVDALREIRSWSTISAFFFFSPLPQMNSASGIGASQELIDCFAKAIDKDDIRVIKVSIVNGMHIHKSPPPTPELTR